MRKKYFVAILLFSLIGCATQMPVYEPPNSGLTSKITFLAKGVSGKYTFNTFNNADECHEKRPIAELASDSAQITHFPSGQEVAIELSYWWGSPMFVGGGGVAIIKFVPELGVDYTLTVHGETSEWSLTLVNQQNGNVTQYKEVKFTRPWDDTGKFCKGNFEIEHDI